MPAGILPIGFNIVKQNSKNSTTNNALPEIDFNDFLECSEIISKYILAQRKRKCKKK